MVELPLDELSTMFARMNSMLLDDKTVDNAVILLSEAAKAAIPRALGAGATVLDPAGRPMSTGSTDATVREADTQQYTLGEGPCLSAWAANEPMLVDDVTDDERWPHWASAIAHLPIRSVLSVPLVHDDTALGAIKVYSSSAGAFDKDTIRLLGLFEGPASALLAHVQSTDLPARLSESLQSADYPGYHQCRQGSAHGRACRRHGCRHDSAHRLGPIERSESALLRRGRHRLGAGRS